MKRISMILICLVGITTWAYGQTPRANEKIEAARIALITKELNLTPEQAQKFWPVYNEFKSRRSEIVRTFKQERRSFDATNATEQERKAMVSRGLELRQQQLDLEKTYSDRLLNVISSTQVIQLRQSEEKFRRLIMERLKDNRQQRRDRFNRENMQQRREDMQRRRNDN